MSDGTVAGELKGLRDSLGCEKDADTTLRDWFLNRERDLNTGAGT